MNILPKVLRVSIGQVSASLVLALGIFCLGTDRTVTYAADSLSGAQTRLRNVREELDSAQSELKRQERRLKDAEDSLARAQKRVEEEKAKLDQAKTTLDESKIRAEQAQQNHDKAYAEIQRLYRERQQGANPTTAPETPKPSN
jgi:septal ring factor EnvC (AmiA/AmiB activator)